MKYLFVKWRLFLLMLLIFPFEYSLSAQNINKKQLDNLNKYIEQAIMEWNVPGLALAIVSDTNVILCRGYGKKDINSKDAVDEHTNFAIASNTKSFTAVLLAMLCERNADFSLDDRVIDHLPYFSLYDPWVTNHITIRDLMCHRAGFETFAGDLLWYASNYNREEVIRRVSQLKPTYEFRTTYGYSNIMVMTAGEIAGIIYDHKGWDICLKELILEPLEMSRTISTTRDLEKMGNYAMPHTLYKKELISIPWLNWDNIGGAGAIISNATDMSHWLQFLINRGTFNGKKLMNDLSFEELWTPHISHKVFNSTRSFFPSTHFKSYGLGFSLFDYLGYKIIGHNGGYDGMISQSLIIPEKKLGFVLMTNSNSSLYYALQYRILDLLLGGIETDWSSIFLERVKKIEAEDIIAKDEFLKSKIPNTFPSLNFNEYSGIYSSPLYGDASVIFKDGALYLELLPSPLFNSTLTHFHYDTFLVQFETFPSLPLGTVTFTFKPDSTINGMEIFIDNPDFNFKELDFTKQ